MRLSTSVLFKYSAHSVYSVQQNQISVQGPCPNGPFFAYTSFALCAPRTRLHDAPVQPGHLAVRQGRTAPHQRQDQKGRGASGEDLRPPAPLDPYLPLGAGRLRGVTDGELFLQI